MASALSSLAGVGGRRLGSTFSTLMRASVSSVTPSGNSLSLAAGASSAPPSFRYHGFHSSSAARQLAGADEELAGDDDARVDEDGGEDDGSGSDDGTGPGGRSRRGPAVGERQGRPFLDPRAPRRIERIRSDPKMKAWGGMVDLLEHATYCNGQREEDPDGFFFDGTVAQYDSDCEGDPFSNGYLTEDEMEFPEEYEPQQHVPDAVASQIYFLYSARGYSIRQLCQRYRLGSEKVCAIIMVKHREPEYIAAGHINPKADYYLQQLYGTRFAPENRFPGPGRPAQAEGEQGDTAKENWNPDYDQGVKYTLLQDDQMPDDVMPIRRLGGGMLRQRHNLKKVTPPKKQERAHDSKFVFKDISGRKTDRTTPRGMLVSDFSGKQRRATNLESLYRSWESRYWTLDEVKGKAGLPFDEKEAHEVRKTGSAATWRLVP